MCLANTYETVQHTVDQSAEQFPDLINDLQERLARRLLLVAEAEAIAHGVVRVARAEHGVSRDLATMMAGECFEVAVVQRFGKYVRREEPGLRTKLPLGLETVRKVAEFGFRTEEPGVRTRFSQNALLEDTTAVSELYAQF
jgi:hypothetical protein